MTGRVKEVLEKWDEKKGKRRKEGKDDGMKNVERKRSKNGGKDVGGNK